MSAEPGSNVVGRRQTFLKPKAPSVPPSLKHLMWVGPLGISCTCSSIKWSTEDVDVWAKSNKSLLQARTQEFCWGGANKIFWDQGGKTHCFHKQICFIVISRVNENESSRRNRVDFCGPLRPLGRGVRSPGTPFPAYGPVLSSFSLLLVLI